jgi:hypothetical protein
MNTLDRLRTFLFREEGSTRSAALIRIGLASLMWSRWGYELLPFRNPGVIAVAIGLSYYLSTTLMFFGYQARAATAWAGLTALAAWYFLGIHGHRDAFSHHHTYLLSVAPVLAAFTSCGTSYSVDRWLAVRRAEKGGEDPPPERAPLWGMRLLALQMSAVYFWGGFEKTRAAFLLGDRLESIALFFYFGSEYPKVPFFHALVVISAVVTTVLEYALAFGLWIPRARKWLIPIGLAFHALLYVSVPVMTFTATMWLLYLAFIPPDTVHNVIERLSGHRPAGVQVRA